MLIDTAIQRIDIQLRFAHHHHNISHHTGPVAGRDNDIDLIQRICRNVPSYLYQTVLLLRIIAHYIGAVPAMHRNTAAAGDIPDNRIARDRITAARQFDHNALFALD